MITTIFFCLFLILSPYICSLFYIRTYLQCMRHFDRNTSIQIKTKTYLQNVQNQKRQVNVYLMKIISTFILKFHKKNNNVIIHSSNDNFTLLLVCNVYYITEKLKAPATSIDYHLQRKKFSKNKVCCFQLFGDVIYITH